MSEDFLSSLDRRVGDHDAKIAGIQRDYTDVVNQIHQLLERINQGLSPSVNAVRKENSEIRLQISELSHKMELSTIEMKTTVRESAELTRTMLQNFEKAKVEPLDREVGFIKKTFVYGIVGAVIVFLGHKGIEAAWDRVFPASGAAAPAHAVRDGE